MKKMLSKINKTWTEDDLKKLSLNALRILSVFVKKNKLELSGEEIKEALKGKLEDKALGASMGLFSKYKNKDRLISPLLKISHGNSIWEIDKKYVSMLKDYIVKIEKYL